MLRGGGQRNAGGALGTVSLFEESAGLQDPCQMWTSSGASVNAHLRGVSQTVLFFCIKHPGSPLLIPKNVLENNGEKAPWDGCFPLGPEATWQGFKLKGTRPKACQKQAAHGPKCTPLSPFPSWERKIQECVLAGPWGKLSSRDSDKDGQAGTGMERAGEANQQ